MTVAEDLLRRHIETLVADNARWQTMLADDVVWELPFAPAIGHPACVDTQGGRAVRGLVRGSRRELPLFDVRVQAFVDPEAAVAEVKGEGRIKATGRSYLQEYVVFLRAVGGKIAFLREYFDPTRAAKAMNAPILLTLGAALVAVTAAQAAPVSVNEILSDPDRFRGQPVTVRGTMSHFREYITRTGTRYYTFDFGDGSQTVRVTSYEKPPCQAGAATVEGTFEQVKWRVKVNYSSEKITAWNVTCFLGHEPKTK